MADQNYYKSAYTGEQIDASLGRIVNGELDRAVDSASESAKQAAASAVQSQENAEKTAADVKVVARAADAERERVAAETARKSAETSRATEEGKRAAAETLRVSNEMARQQAEEGRKTAEEARASNETVRENAEEAREAAEQARADETAGIVARATEKANAAAESAETATTQAGTAVVKASQAAASQAAAKTSETNSKASETAAKNSETAAAGSAGTAKTEADRAKTEADRAAEIVGGDYATKTQLSEGLAGKSNVGHTHTAADVGLGNVPNVATNDQTPTYSESGSLEGMVSGEKLSAAFGKLSRAVGDLRDHLLNKTNPHKTTAEQVSALPTAGGAMTGAIALGGNKITGLGTPAATGDAANKGYVDQIVAAIPTPDVSGQINAHNTNAAAHTDIRAYVDGQVAADKVLKFGVNGTNGQWDRQTAVPTGTQAIRYNGYLRATRVYGMYYSDSADYAEAYPVEGPAEPGDLVMICEDGTLRRNTVRGNAHVVGIVSTAPATVIGAEEDCTTPIAMAGRVPVRTVGEVRPGNFLMGSGIPGALERADENAPRGAIVAQALGAKDDSGEGLVLALVVRL